MLLSRHLPLSSRLHRLGLGEVQRVSHTYQEGSLLDGDSLIRGMEVRCNLVAVRERELNGKRGCLAGVAAHDRHLGSLGKPRWSRPPGEFGVVSSSLPFQGGGAQQQTAG